MANNKIPKAITAKLGGGFTIERLGLYNGLEAFQAYIPDAFTGFPFVFLMEGDKIKKEINGPEALVIINELINE